MIFKNTKRAKFEKIINFIREINFDDFIFIYLEGTKSTAYCTGNKEKIVGASTQNLIEVVSRAYENIDPEQFKEKLINLLIETIGTNFAN